MSDNEDRPLTPAERRAVDEQMRAILRGTSDDELGYVWAPLREALAATERLASRCRTRAGAPGAAEASEAAVAVKLAMFWLGQSIAAQSVQDPREAS
ncbi:MAG: hypothetical protein AAF447_18470 [Myxococcota bacterium]